MSKRLVRNEVTQTQGRRQFGDDLVVPVRHTDALDRAADCLERVMPDLSMLGLAMVLIVLYLAASGSAFGLSDDALAAQQEAAEAASAAPSYVPF